MNAHHGIIVWRFENAPEELQYLSEAGGDEDWVAVIPPAMAGEWIGWMDAGTAFGVCNVREYDHPSLRGYTVRIGQHA